jgi:hypothetical protein
MHRLRDAEPMPEITATDAAVFEFFNGNPKKLKCIVALQNFTFRADTHHLTFQVGALS